MSFLTGWNKSILFRTKPKEEPSAKGRFLFFTPLKGSCPWTAYASPGSGAGARRTGRMFQKRPSASVSSFSIPKRMVGPPFRRTRMPRNVSSKHRYRDQLTTSVLNSGNVCRKTSKISSGVLASRMIPSSCFMQYLLHSHSVFKRQGPAFTVPPLSSPRSGGGRDETKKRLRFIPYSCIILPS